MRPNGIAWKTHSLIDGSPLVVIAVRPKGRPNAKTGAMIQSYILRADVPPLEAVRSGQDSAICGNCPFRPFLARATGGTRCYVNVGHGPREVWDAWQRGRYAVASSIEEFAQWCAGTPLRIGSYGDPGAVDPALWWAAAAAAGEWTGYTHRWQDTGAALRGLCMASVDSPAQRDEAQRLGWTAFRVTTERTDRSDRVRQEAICPASGEAGARVQCINCPIRCNGRGLSVMILDHGPGGIGR